MTGIKDSLMKQFEIKLEIGGNLNNSLLIILLDRWSCCLQYQMRMKNQDSTCHGMSLHGIKEWAQYIVPLQF